MDNENPTPTTPETDTPRDPGATSSANTETAEDTPVSSPTEPLAGTSETQDTDLTDQITDKERIQTQSGGF